MTSYVALLRNIGPATHGKMPLGSLAERCAAAGLSKVTSIGNTGNLVFDTPLPQAEAEAIVTAAVGTFELSSEVFTRTRRQLQMLVGLAPFPDAAAERRGKLGVCFFRKDPHWPASYRNYGGPERLQMFSNHLIVDYGSRIAVSRLTIEKTVGARMTQRNWSTILRIAAALDLSPEPMAG